MQKVTYIVIAIMCTLLLAVAFIVGTSRTQDVTLATDKVESFNSGWNLELQDGTYESIEHIPYYGNSKKHQQVVFENTVPAEFCGKTMSFLSADRMFKIYVGSQLIYTFGYEDESLIGHTPGSVMVFADIPMNANGEKIRIISQSPYANYASYLTDIVVGDRDVAILYFVKAKMPAFIICFGILVCAIIIIIFGIIQKLSNQESLKFFCMGLYILTMFFYHMIETKMPMIFYGNQFLYSNLIFLSLMSAPVFLEGYLYVGFNGYKKSMKVLMGISFVNIGVQLILQFLNVCDFLIMVPISHGILGILIAYILFWETKDAIRKKKVDSTYIGILAMSVCGAIDLARNLWVKVGDLGKYSRVGIFVMGISLIYTYLRDLVQDQIRFVENQKNELFSAEIINTLVAAIDAKDIYTRGHSTRVAQYSMILAKALGWPENRIKSIKYKALLHDVGKIGIPDRVLNKAGKLTEDEYDIIKSHTIMGANILSGVTSLSNMNLVAKNHHERFDGHGYPEGLSGKQIPAEARLVGIADAYDAMASDRAYRKALPKDIIQKELLKGRGTQFDPEMIDVFIELFNSGKLDEIYPEWDDGKKTVDTISFDREEKCKTIIEITLNWEGTVTKEEVAIAKQALEYSIQQSLRDMDMVEPISEKSFLLTFIEIQEKDVHMIVDRIFASFYSNSQNQKIKPGYEIKSNVC